MAVVSHSASPPQTRRRVSCPPIPSGESPTFNTGASWPSVQNRVSSYPFTQSPLSEQRPLSPPPRHAQGLTTRNTWHASATSVVLDSPGSPGSRLPSSVIFSRETPPPSSTVAPSSSPRTWRRDIAAAAAAARARRIGASHDSESDDDQGFCNKESGRRALLRKARLQAPGFAFGVTATVVARMLLDWLCHSGPSCSEMHHMVVAHHREAEVAWRFLEECRASRGAETLLHSPPVVDLDASGFHREAARLHDRHLLPIQPLATPPLSAQPLAAPPSVMARRLAPTQLPVSFRAKVLQYASTWGLFLLDVGLVFFCLRNCCTSAQTLQLLEKLLVQVLNRIGFPHWFCAPKVGLMGGTDQHRLAAHSGRGRDSISSGSEGEDRSDGRRRGHGRCQTSVNPFVTEGFLVRRGDRHPDPVQRRLKKHREQENLRLLQQKRVQVALAISAVLGVSTARLLAAVTDYLSLRFFSHLLTYAVLTIRVCLVVLLVLF